MFICLHRLIKTHVISRVSNQEARTPQTSRRRHFFPSSLRAFRPLCKEIKRVGMEVRRTSGVCRPLGAREPLNKLQVQTDRSPHPPPSASQGCDQISRRVSTLNTTGVVAWLETEETLYILPVAVAAQKDRGSGILCVYI